ncbi:MAG: hypothetical protein QM594_14595 [Niabella sp.]
MKRISRMLLLLILVTTPVVLFVVDNQHVMNNSSRKNVDPGPEKKYKIIYSAFSTVTEQAGAN